MVHPKLDQCERYFIGWWEGERMHWRATVHCIAVERKKDHAAVIKAEE